LPGEREARSGSRLAFLPVGLFALQGGYYAFSGTLALALASASVAEQQIGLIVGFAPLVQVPAALIAGAFIDRFGGSRLLILAAASYSLGASVFVLVPPTSGHLGTLLGARALQGIGVAIVLPAALSLVPLMTNPQGRAMATALVASAHNLTLVLIPPVAFVLLASGSLSYVALLALGCSVVGGFALPRLMRPIWHAHVPGESLRFRFQRRWWKLLISALLTSLPWGGLVAFLPQHAAARDANVALFFVADALAVLALRLPTGWMLDRLGSARIIALGIICTLAGLAVLLQPTSDLVLVLAGGTLGGGAGLQVTAILVLLGRRSSRVDQGAAFALFSVCLAGGQAVGAIAGGLLVGFWQFNAIIFAGLATTTLALVIARTDTKDDDMHDGPVLFSGTAPRLRV
jgi:MFS family permease